jgi:xylan 1,4-beta-xylosidase
MRNRRAILVVMAVLLAAGGAQAQTYRNPIITGMNPDPSICRAGEDYYLVTSTFEYFPGLPIYHSQDLVHWKLIGHALSRPNNNPLMGAASSTGGQYAPTIRYHDGMFYVIGTNYGGKGSQGISYVSAKDPAGPWSDPVWLRRWEVDPSLLFADDKVYYLSPDNKGGFLVGELNLQSGKFVVEPKKVAAGLGGSSPEGPHLYKVGEYYYLMSAEGGTGYQHREVIQRSTSPYGPYERSPLNPVASNMNDPRNALQAIGHADLVETPDGWWLVCLGIRPKGGNFHHLGRETFLAPITWKDGWPRIGDDGVMQQEFRIPKLPPHAWDAQPVRDDFAHEPLALAWNFVRNPHPEDWSLSARPGWLRLNGSPISFKEKDSPAFVCRRQTDFDMVAATKLSFTPAQTNEEAGLVIRGNDGNYFKFAITLADGKRAIKLDQVLKDRSSAVVTKPLADGDIVLRISASALEYQFWIQTDAQPAQQIGTARTSDLSTEVIGGFTGVYIGMYASGNGTKNTNPADFDWFDYEDGAQPPYPWAQPSTAPSPSPSPVP